MKTKKQGLSKLKEDLDDIFSKYIRLKAADSNLKCRCYTCSNYIEWKYIQNGHYWSRGELPLRWSEQNCKPQCVSCNIYKEGNKPAYTQALIREYGESILDILESKKNNKWKPSRFELELLIREYTDKFNKLLKEKVK